ncbi:fibronectin type III domain-containing protein [Cohnella sp. GCM10027633]|uniref:fibronectin type III domain-containing protein n=1 Tax=unclassified Cohnella TaxID=2636738 RepID=UPI003628635B
MMYRSHRRTLSIAYALLGLLLAFSALSYPSQPVSASEKHKPTTGIQQVQMNTSKPAQYGKLEVSFNLNATYSNPFDPDVVDAVAEIRTPSGRVDIVPAFYASDEAPNWKVRYAPREQGKHELVILAKDANGLSRSDELKFQAKKPDAGRGFMGVSGDRFVDSYGKQLTLLGSNYAWGNPPETLAAMPEYKAAGMNLIRVWLTAWWSNYSPEYGPTSTTQNGITMTYDGIGQYNLDNMARMDALMETAKANDLYVMLTLNSFGDFWYDWAYHAYNRDNGGPSGWKENDTDFWYNPEAIGYQKQLLRYIFARWGYSTSLGMLEYWNESDNRVDTSADIRDAWHETLDTYWKSWDFYKRPTTTSFAWKDHAEQHATQDSWDGLDTLDAVNMHLYADDSDIVNKWETNLNALKPFGNRPVFLGEVGKTHNDTSTDAELLNYVHDGVWAPLFRSGAAGANVWWIFENGFDMPQPYKDQYKHLARFIQPEEQYLINMPHVDYGAQSNGTKVGAFQDKTRAMLWINDSQSPYDAAQSRTVSGMSFTVPGLAPGNYQVTFYDTHTGTTIQSRTVAAGAQGVRLDVPNFVRDIAVKASLTGKPTKDKDDPSKPAGLTASSISADTAKLSWSASTDNVGVTGYHVYRDGELVGSTGGLAATFKDTLLKPDTAYAYTVKAIDGAGNESRVSDKLKIRTSAADIAPPSAPIGLVSTARTTDTIDLSWTASADNVGVAGYLVYRGDALVGTTTGTSFQDKALRPGMTYGYTVKARDRAWNVSGAGNAVSVATESPVMSDNLLLNPDFETLADGMPVSWSCEQSWYCAGDTAEKRGGEASLRVSGDTGAWFGIASAAVPAVAGKTYAMDSFVNVSVNNGTTVKVRMQFLNAAGSILEERTVKTYNGTTSGYDNVYGAFVAPAGTGKVRVYIYLEGLNTTINFDDFSIRSYGEGTEEPEEPQGNLLLNAGFDDHNDAWKTAIWTCEKDWLCQWTDQTKRSGTASMRVFTYGADWFSVYQDALASPGKTYTLDGYAQVSALDAGTLQAKLVFYDAQGAQLSEEWIKDYAAVTAGFENAHGGKTAPAGTAKVRVLLYANGLHGDVYLDDFSLTSD